jgi:hypothetical protein
VPQLIGDVFEGLPQVLRFEGEERHSARLLGIALQNFVAARLEVRDVGRDGIDDRIRFVRHFERLLTRPAALVVVAIAQDDDCAPELIARLIHHQFVAAGKENRVV